MCWYRVYLYKDKKEYEHEYEWRTLYYNLEDENDYISVLGVGCLKTIYYNPDNPEKLKPEMSIFYIMDSVGVIFLLIYLCVICKFIIKSKK